MKNKKRFIEALLIFIVIVIFVIFGFIVYKRYVTSDVKEEAINNYYNLEFLFNNGYVKLANTIDSFNNDEIDFSLKNNNLVIKKNSKERIISGLPNNNLKMYFNHLNNDCYEFAGLDNNDLYYVNFCLNDKKDKKFEKISTNVKEIYVPSISKGDTYVVEDDLISNFIVITTLNEVKYISYDDNVLGIYNNIENVMPYFDYVCASDNLKICNDLIVYLTFDRQLVLGYDFNTLIKNDIGEDLVVQDMFGIFETDVDIKNLDDLDFNKFNKKYEYLFTIYVLDKNNDLYTIQMNNKSIMNKSSLVAINASKEKVRNIEYKKNKDNKVNSIVISFVKGDPLEIKGNNNLDIITSTIYDRGN